ncbi:hypothetical protein IP86_12630 [Rhodopseudomonas sp. AAP120]|nr:hypothetical protein IP86_12630 [Rhodopseudomonas sp. AAP120]
MSSVMTRVFNPRFGTSPISLGIPIIVFIFLVFAAPHFTGGENLSNLVNQIVVLLIGSLGQLVVALVGGIDLSIGSLVSLTSCVLSTQDSLVTAIPLCIALAILVGAANGVGTAVFGVHPLIMTFSMATFLQGVAYFILPAPSSAIPAGLQALAQSRIGGAPIAIVWCIAAIGITYVLLRRSQLGLHLYAIGASPPNAHLNGLRVVPSTIAAYIFCSLSAVCAGLFLSARVASADPTMGGPLALDSITAIALGNVQLSGGIGGVLGAVTGALTLGLLANGMNLMGISPFVRSAFTGVLLLVAISLQKRKVIGL